MVNNKDEELRNKIKKLTWEHLGEKISFPQEISEEDKAMNYIIGNLDRPQYLVKRFGKYGITEELIQGLYQVIVSNLANNPNVRTQINEMVATVQKHLEEGVGCQITSEEIVPVKKTITELTISLLVQKNIWWARQDYEKQE